MRISARALATGVTLAVALGIAACPVAASAASVPAGSVQAESVRAESVRAASVPAPEVEALTPIKRTVGFPVGAAIGGTETSGMASELLVRHFGQITPENAMKPEAWYDASHQFAPIGEIAALMDFAAEHDLRVYGHVLVWHSQIPAWFFQDADGEPLTDSAADRLILENRMRDHIFAVAKYLSDGWGLFGAGNPVRAFDVVNEAVADGDSFEDGLRRNEWYRILGEDYIELAFRYADEAFNGTYAARGADRPVALFINDYQTEDQGKRARYLALVDRLLADAVPIDGIGHQFHVTGSTSVDDLARALDDAGGRGLVQAVTEMDVPTGKPESPGRLLEQGYFFRDAFRVFRDHDDELFSVTVWGLYDARSWRRGEGAPLIFDEGLRAKPAYYGIVDGYDGETLLADLPVRRDWTPYWIGLGIAAFAAAMVVPRLLRSRLRDVRRRRLRAADDGATREGAVDALSRPLAERAPRARARTRRPR